MVQNRIREVKLKVYRLDPEKFSRVQRNIILTYCFLCFVGLGIVYLYLREALFDSAWPLIPFVVLLFSIAGWAALRKRWKDWEALSLTITDNRLVYIVPKMPELTLKKADITGVRQVRQGMIVSTRLRKNTLLISKDLRDEDYSAVRKILEKWSNKDS